MIVKVCGMRDADNIRAVEQSGADWMGFIFYERSPRYVAEPPAYLPKHCKRIGVFVNAPVFTIQTHISRYQLDMIQLHGNESPEFCQEIRQLGLPVIKSLPISSTDDFTHWKEYQDSVNYLLFDTACINYGGSGKQFDWSALAQYKGKIPFLLSGGIRLSHLSKIRQFSHPQWIGVDLNSGFETAPGIKDASILHSFIHKLENHL